MGHAGEWPPQGGRPWGSSAAVGWGGGQGAGIFLIHSVLVSLSFSCLRDARLYFFFFNYFELLEMIYELLYQAPNSFITCFLKESSKEQSVSVELEPTANTAPRDL